MSRRLAAVGILLVLTLALGCAGAPVPIPPPAAPAPPPPPPPEPEPEPEPRELETAVDAQRAEELRRETVEALGETVELLDALDPETRRERAGAVSTVETLAAESRQALGAGEVERAHNLAQKALALAREL